MRPNQIVSAATAVILSLSAYVAAGGPSAKVRLCHVPPDNPGNAHTIIVSENAAESHLSNHPGDTLGECPTGCQVSASLCEDGDLCTDDICLADGSCDNPPIGPAACDDGNGCTQDTCDPLEGCLNAPQVGQVCDDGNGCTGSDECDAIGACVGVAIPGCCIFDSDCANDDSCAIGVCENNVCVITPMNCDDGDPCTLNLCVDGSCQWPPIASELPGQCGDGIDNDCDGSIDCADIGDCCGDLSCLGNPSCGAVCGDGIVDPGEPCDDGNPFAGDGCSSFCDVESGYTCSGQPSVCVLAGTDCCVAHPTPGCDDPFIKECVCVQSGATHCCDFEWDAICIDIANQCGASCFVCGNGVIDPSESCDDGDTGDGDGCSSLCTVEPGFICSGQPSVCTAIVCGDGIRESGERCDDGNVVDGDGCSSSCIPEPGFFCDRPFGGLTVCRPTVCGDGIVDPVEACDDGNVMDGDGCSSSCTTEPGFGCTRPFDTPSVCTAFVCGNGVFEPDEICDDGNTADGDGCSSTCTIEPGFICSEQPSVCAVPASDCCIEHPLPGCDDPIIEDCVCVQFGFVDCCVLEWHLVCADIANLCGASCFGCGDGFCDPGEDACTCLDCVRAEDPIVEPGSCTDGIDNNCDGLIDCADPGCSIDPICQP